MSQNKKDGQVHQGNRYNLTLLAMNIAEYVYKDWKSQRPSGWPDFDKTTQYFSLLFIFLRLFIFIFFLNLLFDLFC